MYYDPRGRIDPYGSTQRLRAACGVWCARQRTLPSTLPTPEVFEPTPWETYSYDANDNAGRTHPQDSSGLSEPLEHAVKHSRGCPEAE